MNQTLAPTISKGYWSSIRGPSSTEGASIASIPFHEHDVRVRAQAIEQNPAAIGSDVEVTNLEACGEVADLPLVARGEVHTEEVLMTNVPLAGTESSRAAGSRC